MTPLRSSWQYEALSVAETAEYGEPEVEIRQKIDYFAIRPIFLLLEGWKWSMMV